MIIIPFFRVTGYNQFISYRSPSLPSQIRRETYPITFINESRVTTKDWQQFINKPSQR